MIKLYYNDYEYLLEVDGNRCRDGVVELASARCYTIFLCPYTDGTSWIPITSRLQVTPLGEVVSGVSCVKINHDEHLLTPKFVPAITPKAPEVLLQRNYGEHNITVYLDIATYLLIENELTFDRILLPECPRVIECIDTPEGVLFTAVCNTAVCVILYDYSDYHIILDMTADEIDFDESGITIKKNLSDSQGRVTIEHLHYANSAYISDGVSIEYTNRHKFSKDIIAYEFVESVLAYDYDFADKLLSIPDMTSFLVREFLGEYCNLIIANKPIRDNDYILLANNSGHVRSYSFCVEDGKIIDIVEN